MKIFGEKSGSIKCFGAKLQNLLSLKALTERMIIEKDRLLT